MTTVLLADLALTMDDDLGLVTRPAVVIADGAIAAIGSRGGADAPTWPDDAEVVALSGHWLLPGLVNAHTHAAMSLLRGFADDLPLQTWLEDRIWPVERNLDPDIVYAGTLLAAAEMVPAGVTTWADMYFHLDAAAEAVVRAGARARLAPGLLTPFGPIADQLDAAGDFARRWHGAADGRIRADLGPHAPYTVSPDDLAAVAVAARDLGVGVHIHLSETRAEVERARAAWGRSPIRVAADTGILDAGCLAAHAVWADADDITLLAAAGAAVAHNPRSNLRLASGIAPVASLLAAGVPVGLGTDGAASTSQLTMFEELRTAAMLAKVHASDPTALPARTVLTMATRGGARALRWGDAIGRLAPGLRADVVAVNVDRPGLEPVHDPWSTVAWAVQDRDVARVWVDGRLVARDGRLLTVAPDELAPLVDAATRRLVPGYGTAAGG